MDYIFLELFCFFRTTSIGGGDHVRQLLQCVFGCVVMIFATTSVANALEWEVERNFRYFLYPSDVALQRIAADIFLATNGHAPTPEQLELFMNGKGFWGAKLDDAGPQRSSWPAAWRAPKLATVADLLHSLRAAEGREGRPKSEDAPTIASADREGWASLLGHRSGDPNGLGWTDTCWDPQTREHDGCLRYGDYVRPAGWIVRVYDPLAVGGDCDWSVEGGSIAGEAPKSAFVVNGLVRRSARSGRQPCAELRVYVWSNSDPTAVKGLAHIVRTNADKTKSEIEVTPSDELIVRFGNSFTSGEGGPELPPSFSTKAGAIGDPGARVRSRTRAGWTDRWCHRSVYSWQVRASLDVALRSPHRSVTLLPSGCSGAEIFDGLLFPYAGVEADPATGRRVKGHGAASAFSTRSSAIRASTRKSTSSPTSGTRNSSSRGRMIRR